MIELQKVINASRANEILDCVELKDHVNLVHPLQQSISEVIERIIDELEIEVSEEQLIVANIVLRARLVLHLTEYLFFSLPYSGDTTANPLLKKLSIVLFPDL